MDDNNSALDEALITVTALRVAVQACRIVKVQVRFGNSERWIAIPKRAALNLVAGLARDATPRSAGFFAAFGTVDGVTVYLG